MFQGIVNWEGDKLVMKYTPLEGCKSKPQTHTRSLDGDELTVVSIIMDIRLNKCYQYNYLENLYWTHDLSCSVCMVLYVCVLMMLLLVKCRTIYVYVISFI